jgi:hypothetical protein
MLFVIYGMDYPDKPAERLRHLAAHRAHCDTGGLKIVMSGPLVEDDGERMIGSLFVVDAANRAEVDSYLAADPFTLNGVWERVDVRAFIKRNG